MTHESTFLQVLLAAGYKPKRGNIVADDSVYRCFYGDEKQTSGRYSLKLNNDGSACGWFTSEKDPHGRHDWGSKSDKKLTKSEAAKLKKQAAADSKERKAQRLARHKRLSQLLTKAVRRLPEATEHPYLTKKQIQAHGIKYRVKGNELIIPLYDTDGIIWSAQRITANGWKGLFRGGKKQGHYFSIAGDKDKGFDIIIICEGFSTGASIAEATGYPVVIAVDTGNLKLVAQAVKKKRPDSRIIFACDNDKWVFKAGEKPEGIDRDKIAGDDPRWIEWREVGLLWNPGIEKAHEAAGEIGGAHVIEPEFIDIKNKPTDFNDLAAAEGPNIVKNQINDRIAAALSVVTEDGIEDYSLTEGVAADLDPIPLDAYEEDTLDGDFGLNFKVLGHDTEGTYYYFSFGEQLIVSLTASAHTANNFMRLDDIENFKRRHSADNPPLNTVVTYAANGMMQLAKTRGIFTEENKVRGCGIWLDKGRTILNCGNVLYVDGIKTPFSDLKSQYIYVSAAKLIQPSASPLSNKEAHQLRKICESVTWENPLSGSLLAGWLVVAPICAALSYRPHLFITGEAESGKSTVLEQIIKPAIGAMGMFVDGGTTEPAIREMTGYDARPLVYDEAESEGSKQTMASVIELARKASTGSLVKKFGQRPFKARFCACFSGINPPIDKVADESRISFLVIKKNTKPTAMQDFDDLMDMIDKNIKDDFAERLLARTIANMDTLFQNITIFQRAARRVIKGARASQQIGTMVAGLYLLSRDDVVTKELAEKWIGDYNWEDHTILGDDGDPVRLVQYIASSIIKYASDAGPMREISIGDLIVDCHNEADNTKIDKTLRSYGIAVKPDGVYVANRAQQLSKLLRNTPWEIKHGRTLADVKGAEKIKIFYFAPGVKTNAVKLPLDLFIDNNVEAKTPEFEGEIPWF